MDPSDKPAAPGEYAPLHGLPLLFLTAAIATASFMEILDMTIVNVSVPAISGESSKADVKYNPWLILFVPVMVSALMPKNTS